MAVDREKILQAAQSFLEAQKFDRALGEYQKLAAADPNDTRVLLRIGDIQARTSDYVASISTYDRVANLYVQQGFGLKAVAVYKQIRELAHQYAPDRLDDYQHVVERLTALYAELGLVNEALSTLDEEANRYRALDRDEQAVEMYAKMPAIAPGNPLPFLRLAEGLCRVGQIDQAMESFWAAAELLLAAGRTDDALRVAERMLHFKQDPNIAKAAARIYLDKGAQAEGMQALSRLQISFQADPKDIETLQLLALAFEVIGQDSKAFEVRKEIVRQAHEQGQTEIFQATLRELQQQAPEDEQVRALTQLPPASSGLSSGPLSAHRPSQIPEIPKAPAAPQLDAQGTLEADGAEPIEMLEELEFLEEPGMLAELEEEPAALLVEAQQFEPKPPEPQYPSSGPRAVVGMGPESPPVSPALTQQALADAAAFRSMGLLDKAIETVQVALEFEPQSIELRELLRDLYVDRGDHEGAIEEMLTMAAIYVEYGRPDHAEVVLHNVLEAVPDHPHALRALNQISHAEGNVAQQGVLPAESQRPERDDGVFDAVEEALEEAEFFLSRGHLEDAQLVLRDQLDRTPDHPLLLENLREIEAMIAAQEQADQTAGTVSGAQDAPSGGVTLNSSASQELRESLRALERAVRESQNPSASGQSQQNTIDVEHAFERFKARVRSEVADHDSNTHYDLGAAYKEMGLFDEAVTELELAARDPARECNCFALIGSIYAEQNRWDDAARAYTRALGAPNKTAPQEASLYYDLGDLNEKQGQHEQAAYYFQQALRRDGIFRDARERLARVRNQSLGSKREPVVNDSDDELDRAFEELLGD